jgi:hypothetical protein
LWAIAHKFLTAVETNCPGTVPPAIFVGNCAQIFDGCWNKLPGNPQTGKFDTHGCQKLLISETNCPEILPNRLYQYDRPSA